MYLKVHTLLLYFIFGASVLDDLDEQRKPPLIESASYSGTKTPRSVTVKIPIAEIKPRAILDELVTLENMVMLAIAFSLCGIKINEEYAQISSSSTRMGYAGDNFLALKLLAWSIFVNGSEAEVDIDERRSRGLSAMPMLLL